MFSSILKSKKPFCPTDVTIAAPDYERLVRHLLCNQLEQHAFLLCGLCRSADEERLLVRDLILTMPQDFAEQTPTYLELLPSYLIDVFTRCHHDGYHIVEAHSHPFCRRGVRFSSLDWQSQREKMAWYKEELPDAVVAELVFGHESVDGHRLVSEDGSIQPLRFLRVEGSSGFRGATTAWSQHHLTDHRSVSPSFLDAKPMFTRQELAFGVQGQGRIADATIGVVGCGGLGSVAIQLLAHLGVRKWRLVDHDVIEESNLNRVAFARSDDAEQRRLKVDVMERGIRSLAPDADIQILAEPVGSQIATRLLRTVDLLICAPDNDGARLSANELASAYLIPLLDLGSGLKVEQGVVSEGGGQMVWRFPGEGCLFCAGAIDAKQAALDLMNDEERARHEARYGTSSPQPSIMFLNSVLASIAVGEVTKWLTGLIAPQRHLIYDALAPSVSILLPPPKNNQCPVCHRSAFYGLGDAVMEAWTQNEPIPSVSAHEGGELNVVHA